MRPIPPNGPSEATTVNAEATADDSAFTDTALSPGQQRRWRSLVEVLVMLGLLYGLAAFTINSVGINDDSMRPNLSSGQQVIVNRLSYRLTPPKRGDVVALRNPRDDRQVLTRRVLGLPGEVVDVVGNQVSINGRTLSEIYLDPSSLQVLVGERQSTRRQYRLNEGEYFVLSDKRASGIDSRDWGLITPDKIEGRAWLIYWPPDEINFITQATYEEQPTQ